MNLVEFYQAHFRAETEDFRFLALKEMLLRELIGHSVVDIGCGTGAMARELAKVKFNVLGIESNPQIFALAQQAPHGDCRLLQADIKEIDPETCASFQNFLLIDVLEHYEDDYGMLREVYSKMPHGGQLLCILPALPFLYGRRDCSMGHYRRYSAGMARNLFASCPFRVFTWRYWNIIGVPVYFFFEKILRHPVPEDFRHERKSIIRRVINKSLLYWFHIVENQFHLPLGLSIFVKAVK
ncbi:MAG: class I SAM-dependent methyltransferase [Elusimicrobia bacterium]|nr:class I SAM-dependent methyltransferase [Elusimicrobiota bacterium]